MHVEPAVYQHVEVILGLARHDGDLGVAPGELASELPLATPIVANLLRNLTAAGLLWARPGHGGPRFGLARPPHTITLAEVSAVAAPAAAQHHAREAPGAGAAPAGVAALSASIDACTQRLMAGITVADLIDDGAAARACPRSREADEDDPPPQGGVDAATLWAWAQDGRAHVVLDVRAEPSAEWAAPPWARWMPLERLPQLQHHLPRDRPLVTACTSEARSEMAAQYLRSIGFAHAWALAGGLEAWQRTPPAE